MLVSDYLVGKVQYTEKKVVESLNKLHYVKESILNSKAPVDSSGDLLSHHQKQTLISRNQIETEFMKKKIHFVSEFKLYNNDVNDSTQNFKQALNGLTNPVHSPPVLYRNHNLSPSPNLCLHS